MSITQKIIQIIKQRGEIPLNIFMAEVLNDEESGYYKTNNPFGIKGDFITSPEISQIFGELIALFIVEQWLALGSPKDFDIIEIGAGRGTLQSDILRTLKQVSFFDCDYKIKIVEVNPVLIQEQQVNLAQYNNISWFSKIEEIQTNAPCVILSNEFFDVLPIKQYNYYNEKWYELFISFNETENKLFFINKQLPLETTQKINLQGDHITLETSKEVTEEFTKLLKIIQENKGIILTIDYGYIKATGKNSFRGFKNHKVFYKQEILDNLDNMDLTANVNFGELKDLVDSTMIVEITTQKQFLERLGINLRLEKLIKNNPHMEETLKNQVDMLTNVDKMGEIFKVMVVKSI